VRRTVIRDEGVESIGNPGFLVIVERFGEAREQPEPICDQDVMKEGAQAGVRAGGAVLPDGLEQGGIRVTL
jgi:hypothetical protein